MQCAQGSIAQYLSKFTRDPPRVMISPVLGRLVFNLQMNVHFDSLTVVLRRCRRVGPTQRDLRG